MPVVVRVALLITMAVCAFVVLICLFASFSSSGDSFFATYGALDALMVLVCLASMVVPVLAAIGVARGEAGTDRDLADRRAVHVLRAVRDGRVLG